MFRIRQKFHAVGHGTFFTGRVLDLRKGETVFSWVYDCGSKRSTAIASAIEAADTGGWWGKQIDLVVLSHFDDDHVNGLEQLLRTRRVKRLVLPYMDIAERLSSAASVGSDPCSASTALLQLDPVRWLQTRGLTEQVETVMFVEGTPPGGTPRPPEEEPRPRPRPEPPDEERAFRGVDADDLDSETQAQPGATRQLPLDYTAGLDSKKGSAGPALQLWMHERAASTGWLPIELMFFNTRQANLFRKDKSGAMVARRSGASVADIQTEVLDVVRRYRLEDSAQRPRHQWREKLRSIYGRHFGNSSQERNNISLCLLVRPTWAHFGIFRWRTRAEARYFTALEVDRPSLLCLGDLHVHGPILDEMQDHFGDARWESLAIVQVPHHGSRHSWEPGSARAFSPHAFVQCAPSDSPHHPHASVKEDLEPFLVMHADYIDSVYIAWSSI